MSIFNRKWGNKAAERHTAIINELHKTIENFTSRSDKIFGDVMNSGLRPIADMVDLDRIVLCRRVENNDDIRFGQIYRWDRTEGGAAVPNVEMENFTCYEAVPGWENIIKNGGTVNGPIRTQPEHEAAAMKKLGVVSIFVTPVFINNALWGMMVFEDHRNERRFEDDYAEVMRSAAFLCVNTIIRADMERIIDGADELARAVKEASPLSYVLFNEDMQTIDCNDVMLRILACPDKQYFLEHYWDFFSPESQPDGSVSFNKAIAKRDEAFKNGKVTFEWVHRSSNGELIPMENTMTQVIHHDTKLIISFKYDLRNTKRMMESIREQSELIKIRLEQQELISDISRGFIASGDSETYVKEAIAKLGRYHKVSMVVIFGIDYQRDETYMAYQWSADGNPPRLVKFGLFDLIKSSFPGTLPDCSTVPVISYADVAAIADKGVRALLSVDVNAFICAPLYVEGYLWGVMSVEQRFTPRQWTDNEKGFVAMTASTIAGVIMRDIYNTKLKDALHKATAASRAKSEFLSNMSHEMRTPLNAIIGMTTIGRNAANIERKDYALDKINDASTHLLGVINDVLDMSKIEANMLELSPVEFNFEKMLQKVIAVVNFRIEEKHQKLAVHIDQNIPPTLIGDDQRLAQVLTNMRGNAVKFTDEDNEITLNTH
jgi:GAF domain-containing protein